MIPPSKRHLEALAGWVISLRHLPTSNQQQLALGKFQDGCSELAQVVDDLPQSKPQQTCEKTAVESYQDAGPAFHATIPIDVQQAIGVQQEDGKCVHKFDIKTQHCVYCGVSYRKAKGKKPELF